MSGVLDWTVLPTAAGFLFRAKQTLEEACSSMGKAKSTISIPNDFFSTVLSLAKLNFSPKGTKLVLDGSRFSAHPKTIWQALSRMLWYKESIDKQADVATAIALFAVFLEPYDSGEGATLPPESAHARTVLELAKKGLKRLKSTYKDEKGDKHSSLKTIKDWRGLIDNALKQSITIEEFTEEKRAFLQTIYDCWADKLPIIAAMCKEAERVQHDADPDQVILCDSELNYLTAVQDKLATVLPAKFEAKLRVNF